MTELLDRRAHDRTREYPCPYCGYVSIGEAESKRHRNTHPKETRVLTCETCGQVFRNAGSAYIRHLETHDPALVERHFWEKVYMTSECWLWTGSLDTNGYGQLQGLRRKRQMAHRMAYEGIVGPIPDGLTLDHLCRNTRCVRPDHLEPVTHYENLRRAHEYHSAKGFPCPAPGCRFVAELGGALAAHLRHKHPELYRPKTRVINGRRRLVSYRMSSDREG